MKIFLVTRISEHKSIDCENAQVSNLANKIATQWWPIIIIKDPKLYITFIFYFLVIMFTLCSWFDQKGGFSFT